MHSNTRFLLPLFFVVILATVSSCVSNPESGKTDSQKLTPATPNSIASPNSSQKITRDKSVSTNPPTPKQPVKSLAANSEAATKKSIPVTLYTSDAECQELLPKKTEVSAQEPITSAVGKILEERDTSDLSLSGYRINVQNGVATVDLRVSPESKRQLASLSSCEQFALFGSVRKTLTSNAQWKIKEVRFTEQGKEIVL
ncbi:MAG TPA: sporulation/spore germination protein [Nostocaceae cyanobacterium]|nr:sporulation/spore germination protein [Nostocaceae cyanobacterium]